MRDLTQGNITAILLRFAVPIVFSRIFQLCYSLADTRIIGGALGNVIDRIRLGAVFDFLDFSIGTYHWPAFNAADSFICVGALIVIFHGLWNTKKTA